MGPIGTHWPWHLGPFCSMGLCEVEAEAWEAIAESVCKGGGGEAQRHDVAVTGQHHLGVCHFGPLAGGGRAARAGSRSRLQAGQIQPAGKDFAIGFRVRYMFIDFITEL